MTTHGAGGPFATLTHARLRAAQGDVDGAVRILRVILEAQPDHGEARDALDALLHRVPVAYHEPAPPAPDEARPSSAADLKDRFRAALSGGRSEGRIRRLNRWIERIRRNRGKRRVR
jgi:hypothetical protein